MYRLGTSGEVRKMEFYLLDGYNTGISFGAPGLPSSYLFFSHYDSNSESGVFPDNEFLPDECNRHEGGPETCRNFCFLFNRKSVGGSAGTTGNELVNINTQKGPVPACCQALCSLWVLPKTKAHNVYVADSCDGNITKLAVMDHSEVIAASLKFPIGLA